MSIIVPFFLLSKQDPQSSFEDTLFMGLLVQEPHTNSSCSCFVPSVINKYPCLQLSVGHVFTVMQMNAIWEDIKVKKEKNCL